jgi:hypothetical protein
VLSSELQSAVPFGQQPEPKPYGAVGFVRSGFNGDLAFPTENALQREVAIRDFVFTPHSCLTMACGKGPPIPQVR